MASTWTLPPPLSPLPISLPQPPPSPFLSPSPSPPPHPPSPLRPLPLLPLSPSLSLSPFSLSFSLLPPPPHPCPSTSLSSLFLGKPAAPSYERKRLHGKDLEHSVNSHLSKLRRGSSSTFQKLQLWLTTRWQPLRDSEPGPPSQVTSKLLTHRH